jgi:hypothetical protein
MWSCPAFDFCSGIPMYNFWRLGRTVQLGSTPHYSAFLAGVAHTWNIMIGAPSSVTCLRRNICFMILQSSHPLCSDSFRHQSKRSGPASHPSSLPIIKNRFVPMRSLNNCIRRIEICPHISPNFLTYPPPSYPLTNTRPPIRARLHLDIQIAIDFANDLDGMADRQVRVAVQNNVHVAAGVDDGGFAAQLDDFAEDAHDAVLKLGEVRGEDARCLGVVHRRSFCAGCDLVGFVGLRYSCWMGGLLCWSWGFGGNQVRWWGKVLGDALRRVRCSRDRSSSISNTISRSVTQTSP